MKFLKQTALIVALSLGGALVNCSSKNKDEQPSAAAKQEAIDKAVKAAVDKATRSYEQTTKELQEKIAELEDAGPSTTTVEVLPKFVEAYLAELQKLDVEWDKLQALVKEECLAASTIEAVEAKKVETQIDSNLGVLSSMEKAMEPYQSGHPAQVAKIIKDIQTLKKYFEWMKGLTCLRGT